MSIHRICFADILMPILCFHGLIINISPGNAIGQYVQLICCIIPICFFCEKGIYGKSVKGIIWTLFFLFVSMNISTFLVRYQHTLGYMKLSNPFTPLLLSCQILSFLGLSLYTKRRKSLLITFNTLYYVSLLYVIIMSVYAFSLGRNDDPDRYFIFQNKFDFSYLLLFVIALYCDRHPKFKLNNILFLYILVAYACYMAYWVDCTTGILLSFFMLIALTFKKIISPLLTKKNILFFSLPIFDIGFFLFYNILLSSPNVSYFIENVLGKESSLTGRVYIYEAMKNIIWDHPFWGVGPRNGTAAMAYLVGKPNSQNGLMYLYLEIGLMGILFFMYIYMLLIKKTNWKRYNYGVLIYLYCMILASIVEITIGTNFLCYSCLLLIPTIAINQKNKII